MTFILKSFDIKKPRAIIAKTVSLKVLCNNNVSCPVLQIASINRGFRIDNSLGLISQTGGIFFETESYFCILGFSFRELNGSEGEKNDVVRNLGQILHLKRKL